MQAGRTLAAYPARGIPRSAFSRRVRSLLVADRSASGTSARSIGVPRLRDFPIDPDLLARLRDAAIDARRANYSPYSKFVVLAAVETESGIFGGTNVENVNFTLTKHAEEVAILRAMLGGAGPRGQWIKTLYVTSAPPCGSCRQFAAEFGGPQTVVLIDRLPQSRVRRGALGGSGKSNVEAWRLSELLPGAFKPKHIRSQS
jgi:cytidine deaminase